MGKFFFRGAFVLLGLLFLTNCVSITVPLGAPTPDPLPPIQPPKYPFVPVKDAANPTWENPQTMSVISAFQNCERPEIEMPEFIKGFRRKLKHDRLVLLESDRAFIIGETEGETLRVYFSSRHLGNCKTFFVLSDHSANTTDRELFFSYARSFQK